MTEHLPYIQVFPVPHRQQRYDTAGDYQETVMGWQVFISKLPDWRYEFLVALHELAEMALTKHHGVPWEVIDKFDMDHPELDDPGACKHAPYHLEHMDAEKLERLAAHMLEVEWDEYQIALDALGGTK